MTPELFYLILTALLVACLWIPYIVGVNMHNKQGIGPAMTGAMDPSTFPLWVKRANRVHQNLVEQFAPFAAIIIILHLIEVSNPITVWTAAIFFYLRIAHAVIMWSGIKLPLRPIIFTAAWIAILVLAWQALAA